MVPVPSTGIQTHFVSSEPIETLDNKTIRRMLEGLTGNWRKFFRVLVLEESRNFSRQSERCQPGLAFLGIIGK